MHFLLFWRFWCSRLEANIGKLHKTLVTKERPDSLCRVYFNLDIWYLALWVDCCAVQHKSVKLFSLEKMKAFLWIFQDGCAKISEASCFQHSLICYTQCFFKTSFASNAVRMFPAMTNHLLCSNKSGAALRHKKSCQLRKFSHNVCSAPQLNLFSKVW